MRSWRIGRSSGHSLYACVVLGGSNGFGAKNAKLSFAESRVQSPESRVQFSQGTPAQKCPWRCHSTARQLAHPSRFESTAEESQCSAGKVWVKSAGLSHHISGKKQESSLRACQCAKGLSSSTLGRPCGHGFVDSCQLYYPVLTAKQWPTKSSSLHSKPQKSMRSWQAFALSATICKDQHSTCTVCAKTNCQRTIANS